MKLLTTILLMFFSISIFAEDSAGIYVEPYENAEEAGNMSTALDITGKYGVAFTGNHLAIGSDENPDSHPRVQTTPTEATLSIPAGAKVKYAFLYYGGSINLDGIEKYGMTFNDFTPDNLNTIEDVKSNHISFEVDGQLLGPFDNAEDQPDGQTHVGSDSVISSKVFTAKFGTLFRTATGHWGNRLDVTNYFKNLAGDINVKVYPPEKVDLSANDADNYVDNPAGSAEYNSCLGSASWGMIVIYKHHDEPVKQLILKDGDILQAWDYAFIHLGDWWRPKVTFNHKPIKKHNKDLKFYVYTQGGTLAGKPIPTEPLCTCGCGGILEMAHGEPAVLETDLYFSNVLHDPVETLLDPLHRDSTNGPWHMEYKGYEYYAKNGTFLYSMAGNDWTLFQSGNKYTEFPNLYEGSEQPVADGIQPVTLYNTQTMLSDDVYAGHPWEGRGEVTYHATGNEFTILEVAPNPENIEDHAKSTTLWFKGDQKDVWKPQGRVMVRALMLSVPVQNNGNGHGHGHGHK